MSAQPFLLRMAASAHLSPRGHLNFLGANPVNQTLENDAHHGEAIILFE